jgi:segregation and condensation protein B
MSQTPDAPFPRQQGISLDELAAAYAQAMGTAMPPPEEARGAGCQPAEEEAPWQPAPREEAAPPPPEPAAESSPEDDACCPIGPRSILEAMLFVGDPAGQPLSPARAAEFMRGVEADEIPGLVEELNQRYAVSGAPYQVLSEEGGYRMTLRQSFHGLRDQFYGRVREARLSLAAVDVLSIVAYRQPLTADEVSRLRDKPSGHVLAQLVHRGLLRIERTTTPRRTAHYHTTDRFLELFGLSSLADLPQSEELG